MVASQSDEVASLNRRLAILEDLSGELPGQQAADLIRGLRARLLWLLEQRVMSIGSLKDVTEERIPTTWDELETFADHHLAGAVVLTPRAIKAARASDFLDIPFAYRVLRFLADELVSLKRGDAAYRNIVAETMKRLRLDGGPVGAAPYTHMTRESYQVKYLGRTLSLDSHLQGSSVRDPRRCFRLYYAWSEEDQLLIVGHFPGHLDNSFS